MGGSLFSNLKINYAHEEYVGHVSAKNKKGNKGLRKKSELN